MAHRSTYEDLRRLVRALDGNRTRNFVIDTVCNLPAYVNTAHAQQLAARAVRLGTGDLALLRDEATSADRQRTRAHDLAQYACVRVNRACSVCGLRPIAPDVPTPEEAGGHIPAVRDLVAGFAARVTLDTLVDPSFGSTLRGRELLDAATTRLGDDPDGRYDVDVFRRRLTGD